VFEWDPKKAAANLVKHGVSFDEATTILPTPERWRVLTSVTRRRNHGSSGLDDRFSIAFL